MNCVKKCGFCQNPADLMCSRCLEVYCSVECQIRDWSEHKKICVPIPKLYRNDSYLDVLAGGVALPPKSSASIELPPNRILNNNARSLKPLRKPNLLKGPGEVLVEQVDLEAPPVTPALDEEGKKLALAQSEKTPNITITTVDSERRMAKMSIDDIPERSAIQDHGKSTTEPEKPQQLSKLKLEIERNHIENHKKIMAKAAAQAAASKPTWMLHFPLEKADGEVFEAVVQYVLTDQTKRCWVISADHETQCDKLLRDINGQVNPNGEPVQFDAAQVNDICTAPYEGIYYRAVVLEKMDPARSLITVRLIDYGNELTVPASDLRGPLPLMKNLRAFAFLVEIQNLNRPLELAEVIRISIVRTESDRKIVKMDLAPVSLLHWIGNSEQNAGEGGIVAILSPRKALVMLSSSPVTPVMKLVYTQLPEEAGKFPAAENAAIGDVICVELADCGWSRALIIEQHDDNRLVFTVDNGTVELIKVQDARVLPELYKHKPWLVLYMEVTKVVTNEQDFKRVCFTPTFSFTFERLEFNKVQRTMTCTMKDAEGKRELAVVEFMDFVCDLKKVGISNWQHIPQDKSIVKISSALDVGSIVVCPKGKLNVFTELLQSVMPSLKRLTAVPKVKDIVIAVDDLMMPYRARVLSNVSPTDVEVLDLDNGIIKKTALQKLYEINGFVSNLPVYTRKVQLLDMNVSAVQDHDCIIDQLDAFRSEKREFRMQFEGGSYIYGVKMMDLSTNRSLATILLENHDKKLREVEEAARKKREQIEEAAQQKAAAAAAEASAKKEAEAARAKQEAEAARAKQEAEAARAKQEAEAAKAKQQAEAARAEQERKQAREAEDRKKAEAAASKPSVYTINDLELVALPVGKTGVKLSILDDGDLAQGAVTVCELTEENMKRYSTLNEKVNKLAAKCGGDGYCPKLEELCLAIFDDDKLWYRAACVKIMPDNDVFVVLFIDYGNVAAVKRESIRMLPKDLAFACAAHTCAVNDHTTVLKIIAKQQATLGHVVPKEIKSEGEIYSLKF